MRVKEGKRVFFIAGGLKCLFCGRIIMSEKIKK